MRTLDEVITVMNHVEFCCTNCKLQFDCDEVECFLEDALHYLKEFQGLSKMWNDKLDKEQKNEPLTWDELKTMEGKPVWVEYNFQISDKKFRDNSKRWCVIREFEHWHDTEIIITDNGFVLSKNEQVTDWQAYRKERS